MFNQQRRILLLFIIATLLLGACKDVALSSGDIRILPEAVKDGTVSEECYQQITDFYRSGRQNIQLFTDLLDTQIESDFFVPSTEYESKINGFINFFESTMDRYNIEPITEVDKEIHFLMEEAIQLHVDAYELEKDYLRTEDEKDEFDLYIALSKAKNAINSLDIAVYKLELVKPQQLLEK